MDVQTEFYHWQLIQTSFKGDLTQVKDLIENKKVDPGYSDYDGRTALHLACAEGHEEIVAYLITKGALVNAEDRFGGTPLQDALRDPPKDQIAKLLRKSHARLVDSGTMTEKLCSACGHGDLPLVKRLIENGAEVNSCDYDKRTPLHLASSEGHIFIVELLVSNGAKVNAVDRWGGTPLMDAMRGKHDTVSALLRKNGASVASKKDLASALCEAASTGDLPLIRRLVENGASIIDAYDYDKRTALHLAAAEGHLDVVEYLVDKGMDVNAKDRWDGTPLDDALRHNCTSVSRYLKSKNAVPSATEQKELQAEHEKIGKFLKKNVSTQIISSMPVDTPESLKEIDTVELVSKMKNSVDFSQFQMIALPILHQRLMEDKEDAVKGVVIHEEGVELLLALATSYNRNDKIMEHCLGSLEEIALVDRFAPIISSEGGVRILLDALKESNHLPTKVSAAGALANITFISAGGADQISKSFSKEGGIKVMLSTLRKSKEPELLRKSVNVLWQVCVLEADNIDRLKNENGLDTITYTWKYNKLELPVVLACSGAVSTFLTKYELRTVFMNNLGGIELLLSSLKHFLESERLCSTVACILCLLSLDEQNNSEARVLGRLLQEKKGIDLIVQVMNKYPKNLQLQENSSLCLYNVAKAYAKDKSVVMACGVKKAIGSAKARHPNSGQLKIIYRDLIELDRDCCLM